VGRLPTILLALVVALANAFCACAGIGRVEVQATVAAVANPHEGCHGHAAAAVGASCHSSAEDDGERDGDPPCGDGPHSCPHCTGTVVADASSSAKTSVATLVPALDVLLPLVWPTTVAAEDVCAPRPLHTGLPPPIGRPTLLSLSCSLTT